MMRVRLVALALILAAALGAVSCKEDGLPVTDYYPHHCELALPLPHVYAEMQSDKFDAAFTDGRAVVGMVRISFAASQSGGVPTTLDPMQFAEYYMLLSEREETVKQTGDVPYYSYEENGYFYTYAFYRSRYAYFTVLYTCIAELRADYENDFLEYASGAYFTA